MNQPSKRDIQAAISAAYTLHIKHRHPGIFDVCDRPACKAARELEQAIYSRPGELEQRFRAAFSRPHEEN